MSVPGASGRAVKRVVVAGGGTAGWTAVAALARQLGPLLDITLVESEQIGTVGVGEATIPTFRSFHALLGIDEREFMRETQASFKLGIAFENWARQGDRYIHPFGDVGKLVVLGGVHEFPMRIKCATLPWHTLRAALDQDNETVCTEPMATDICANPDED